MIIVLIFVLIFVLSDYWVLTQNITQLELVRVSTQVIIFGRYDIIMYSLFIIKKSNAMYHTRVIEDTKLLNFLLILKQLATQSSQVCFSDFITAIVVLFVISKITTSITKEFHITDHRLTNQTPNSDTHTTARTQLKYSNQWLSFSPLRELQSLKGH